MRRAPGQKVTPAVEFSRGEKITLVVCFVLLLAAFVDYWLFHARYRDLAIVVLVVIVTLYLQMKARALQRRRR